MLEQAKRQLTDRDRVFGGHFRNYLKKRLDKPEFADHICCWFPEDDLRIEYSRKRGRQRLVTHYPGLARPTLGGAVGIPARVWR